MPDDSKREIESFALRVRAEILEIMDEMGPAYYEAVLAEVRSHVEDLETTAAKWKWAGRLPAKEREAEQREREARGEY